MYNFTTVIALFRSFDVFVDLKCSQLGPPTLQARQQLHSISFLYIHMTFITIVHPSTSIIAFNSIHLLEVIICPYVHSHSSAVIGIPSFLALSFYETLYHNIFCVCFILIVCTVYCCAIMIF